MDDNSASARARTIDDISLHRCFDVVRRRRSSCYFTKKKNNTKSV